MNSRLFRPLLLSGIAIVSLAIGACETKESSPMASDSALRECTDEDLIAFVHVPFQEALIRSAWGDARSVEVSLRERSLGLQILLREGQVETSSGIFWKSEILCIRGLQKLDSTLAPLRVSLPYRIGERGVRHRTLNVSFAQEQVHFRFEEGRAPRVPVAWAAKRIESGFSVLSYQESQGWEAVSRSTLANSESSKTN